MYINPKLFGFCFCPIESVARVCLKGTKDDLPKELNEYGIQKDGEEDYDPGCFSINILVDSNGKPNGGVISYMDVHALTDYCPCDNYEEAYEYYKSNASEGDMKEMLGGKV